MYEIRGRIVVDRSPAAVATAIIKVMNDEGWRVTQTPAGYLCSRAFSTNYRIGAVTAAAISLEAKGKIRMRRKIPACAASATNFGNAIRRRDTRSSTDSGTIPCLSFQFGVWVPGSDLGIRGNSNSHSVAILSSHSQQYSGCRANRRIASEKACDTRA